MSGNGDVQPTVSDVWKYGYDKAREYATQREIADIAQTGREQLEATRDAAAATERLLETERESQRAAERAAAALLEEQRETRDAIEAAARDRRQTEAERSRRAKPASEEMLEAWPFERPRDRFVTIGEVEDWREEIARRERVAREAAAKRAREEAEALRRQAEAERRARPATPAALVLAGLDPTEVASMALTLGEAEDRAQAAKRDEGYCAGGLRESMKRLAEAREAVRRHDAPIQNAACAVLGCVAVAHVSGWLFWPLLLAGLTSGDKTWDGPARRFWALVGAGVGVLALVVGSWPWLAVLVEGVGVAAALVVAGKALAGRQKAAGEWTAARDAEARQRERLLSRVAERHLRWSLSQHVERTGALPDATERARLEDQARRGAPGALAHPHEAHLYHLV